MTELCVFLFLKRCYGHPLPSASSASPNPAAPTMPAVQKLLALGPNTVLILFLRNGVTSSFVAQGHTRIETASHCPLLLSTAPGRLLAHAAQ